MTRRLFSRPVALFAALTLSATLAACGGGDDDGFEPEGNVDDSPSASTDPSPSNSPSPTGSGTKYDLSLPPDVQLVFDVEPTGDPVKDAIIEDWKNSYRAVYHATYAQQVDSPALEAHFTGEAILIAQEYLKFKKDKNQAVTGTKRYYAVEVDTSSGQGIAAELTWCEDEREFFAKELNTGKVLTTTPSLESFIFTRSTVSLNEETGIWQIKYYQDIENGSKHCQELAS